MFANLKTVCCVVTLLAMPIPVLGQTQEEIDKLRSSILNPLQEPKLSKEELSEAKKQTEEYAKSKPKLVSLLTVKKIKAELELADYQIEQMKDLRKRIREIMGSSALSASSGETGEIDIENHVKHLVDLAKRSDEIQSQTNEIDVQMIEILLPHQRERLQQIATQIHITRAGMAAAMLHPSCADVLGISDEQKEQINERSIEVSEKLTNEIAKLRKRAQEQVRSELTPKQRSAFQKLIGDKFEIGIGFPKRDLHNSRRSKMRPNIFEVLTDKKVMQEIELLSDQLKGFRKLQAEKFAKMQDLYQGDSSELRQKLKTLESESKSRLEEILLAHQTKRLQQIVTQIHINRAGESAALVHPETAEALGISDEQRTRIKSRAKEVSGTLKEETTKLNEKANNRVASLLDAKQRELLKELVGEKFEL